MSSTSRARTVLLGPQGDRPVVAAVLAELGVDGTVAMITSGWEEREDDDGALIEWCGGRAVNLRLHARRLEILQADQPLAASQGEADALAEELRELYRVRLDHGMAAVRQLHHLVPRARHLGATEVDSALAAVAELDTVHLVRLAAVASMLRAEVESGEHPEVQRHRGEVAEQLAGCSALVVAGGHVGELVAGLTLFGIDQLAADLPIVAWSAGAMALTERVVVAEPMLPAGGASPEVYDRGLDRCHQLVALADAAARLPLGDPEMLASLARRMAPRVVVLLDEGDRVDVGPDGRPDLAGARVVGLDGLLHTQEAA